MRRLLVLALLATLVLAAQIKDSSADPPMMVIEMKPGDTHLDDPVRSGVRHRGRFEFVGTRSFREEHRGRPYFL